MMSWAVKSVINKVKLISLISLFSQVNRKGEHTAREKRKPVHFFRMFQPITL